MEFMINKIHRENPVTYCYTKGKQYLKEGNDDKARDYFDMGLAFVARKRKDGWEVDQILEGTKIETWLMRFWVKLENNNLLL